MLIVAIAWIYVVGLIAVTQASVAAGIMTFLLYCVLPLGFLYYVAGSRKRKAKRDAVWQAAHQARQAAQQAAAPATTATPAGAPPED